MPLKDNLINDADSFKQFLLYDRNLKRSPANGDYITFLKDVYPNNYQMQMKTITDFYNKDQDGINRPVLMEFLTVQGDMNALEILLNKEKELGNIDVWWSLYDLLLKRRKGQINGNELINIVYQMKNVSNESLVFSLILHLYGILDINLFEPLHKIRKAVEPLVDLIENDFLRNSFHFRLIEMQVLSSLFINDKKVCRKLCLSVISDQRLESYYPVIFSNFFHVLGQTYIFEDFQLAEYWISKAKNNLNKFSGAKPTYLLGQVENTLDFLKSLWKCNINGDLPKDRAELAHRYLALGEKNKAIEVLDQLKCSKGKLTSYQLFYYALASEDADLLDIAGDQFKEESNFFYYQLFQPDILNRYRTMEREGIL